MATRRTHEFLDGNKVRYATIKHSDAYTAEEVAKSAHLPGRWFAKTVVVKLDGQFALAVVPATRHIDIELLRRAAGAKRVEIAEKSEFEDRFEGCQLGTMPPFGNVFGMPTYIDNVVAKRMFIAFNAGTHNEVIVMRFDDYRRLAHPKLAKISLAPIAELVASQS